MNLSTTDEDTYSHSQQHMCSLTSNALNEIYTEITEQSNYLTIPSSVILHQWDIKAALINLYKQWIKGLCVMSKESLAV